VARGRSGISDRRSFLRSRWKPSRWNSCELQLPQSKFWKILRKSVAVYL
jgi:hypothetical protein